MTPIESPISSSTGSATDSPIAPESTADRRAPIDPTRIESAFDVAGTRCAAWLYTPSELPAGARRWPLVVMAHGFSGTRRDRLGPFAERFAAAGIAALVFDYRGFGDSEGAPDMVDVSRQLEDWRAAVAHARSLAQVDAERVAVWGTSFGGGHALTIAAEDGAIAAAVSQVPFLDSIAQFPRPPLRALTRLLGHGLLDLLRARRGSDPHFIPAVAPHGQPGFITAPGAEAGWLAVVAGGEDSRWRNRAAARTVFARPYRPARKAAQIHCPLLVCVGDRDLVAPPRASIRAARVAPRGELRRYPIGHFDIYSGEPFERAVRDQLEFLRDALCDGA